MKTPGVVWRPHVASKLQWEDVYGWSQGMAPPVPLVETTIAAMHSTFLAGGLTCSGLVAAYMQVGVLPLCNTRDALSLLQGESDSVQTVSLKGCTADCYCLDYHVLYSLCAQASHHVHAEDQCL